MRMVASRNRRHSGFPQLSLFIPCLTLPGPVSAVTNTMAYPQCKHLAQRAQAAFAKLQEFTPAQDDFGDACVAAIALAMELERHEPSALVHTVLEILRSAELLHGLSYSLQTCEHRPLPFQRQMLPADGAALLIETITQVVLASSPGMEAARDIVLRQVCWCSTRPSKSRNSDRFQHTLVYIQAQLSPSDKAAKSCQSVLCLVQLMEGGLWQLLRTGHTQQKPTAAYAALPWRRCSPSMHAL